ncbi:MAG: aminotransferase class V-fold PLP-dependent enzyme, partial [Bacteriovorax sp.]
MYKKYYKLFLEANAGVQHYASHSHHYWPDVTRGAMLEYWDDSARFVDDKWEYIFSKKMPETQKLIADVLHLSSPEQIAFAPNTHEFVYRLLSCFDPRKKISILTTDSEFYSFDRQVNRLSEEGIIEIEKVPTLPFDNFEKRFIDKIKNHSYDMIFLSHVFFNSGMAVKNLKEIVDAVTDTKTMIVIDGYHGFMALPTDLSEIESRAFYLAGSYKYAQGGEGCCFL